MSKKNSLTNFYQEYYQDAYDAFVKKPYFIVEQSSCTPFEKMPIDQEKKMKKINEQENEKIYSKAELEEAVAYYKRKRDEAIRDTQYILAVVGSDVSVPLELMGQDMHTSTLNSWIDHNTDSKIFSFSHKNDNINTAKASGKIGSFAKNQYISPEMIEFENVCEDNEEDL